jgi:hypothetical protein
LVRLNLPAAAALACILAMLAGCTQNPVTPISSSAGSSHSIIPSTPAELPPRSGPSASPTPGVDAPGGDSGSHPQRAGELGRKACTDFGATFTQKVDVKFRNQDAATAAARDAQRLDPQWKPIADDMALIADVGKRINVQHATVTADESNTANQAVTDLQQRCTSAGAAFQLPSD